MNSKVIISGHSAGLGLALAAHYLHRGYMVLGLARRTVGGWPSEKLQQYPLDLSDSKALADWLSDGLLKRFVQDAEEIVLINNAGVVVPNAVAGAQDAAAISRAVSLNVTAPLLLSNAAVAAKPDAAQLKIVHISSGAGRNAYPGWSVYGATKAALDHHALCMAAEAHQGVSIISVAPGVVDTGMQAEIRAATEETFPLRQRFVDLKQQGGLSVPADTAARIAAMIADASFGETVVRDVRD
ncbi:MAG: SDR family NAD(P)-dependent oxidoreductase [Neisseria sp.]|nr:SDR family NAD(P)-dependent oxidoreductase [Neisseria sp.]